MAAAGELRKRRRRPRARAVAPVTGGAGRYGGGGRRPRYRPAGPEPLRAAGDAAAAGAAAGGPVRTGGARAPRSGSGLPRLSAVPAWPRVSLRGGAGAGAGAARAPQGLPAPPAAAAALCGGAALPPGPEPARPLRSRALEPGSARRDGPPRPRPGAVRGTGLAVTVRGVAQPRASALLGSPLERETCSEKQCCMADCSGVPRTLFNLVSCLS